MSDMYWLQSDKMKVKRITWELPSYKIFGKRDTDYSTIFVSSKDDIYI